MQPATHAFLDASRNLAHQIRDAERAVYAMYTDARSTVERARFEAERAIDGAHARHTAGSLDDDAAAEEIHRLTDHHRTLSDELGVIEVELLAWRERGRLANPSTVDQILAWARAA